MSKLLTTILSVCLLSGCISYKPANQLSDRQLCERMAFAYDKGKTDRLFNTFAEVKNRLQLNVFTLSKEDCNFIGKMALRTEHERKDRAQQLSDSLNSLNATYNQQQPKTTTCNNTYTGFNCTTF